MEQELNGKKYTMIEEEGGEIRLIPVEEVHEPEVGDVYMQSDFNDSVQVLDDKGGNFHILDSGSIIAGDWTHAQFKGEKYLGKFNDVFVRIADVKAALSHKDSASEDMTDFFREVTAAYGALKTAAALRELKILD